MFMKYALRWLLLALAVRIVVCSLVGFFDVESLIMKQNVPKQQIYFEVPFYMFVIVITAFFFVWRQFYEITLNILEKEDEEEPQPLIHSAIQNASGIKEPLLDGEQKENDDLTKDIAQSNTAEIDKRLSQSFHVLTFTIFFLIFVNTLMCLLHYGDSPDSIYTTRYEIGYILYLIAFTLLFFIKIGVMIFGY